MCAQSLSHVWLFVTPWTVTSQAPLSMWFPRQEYWSGLSFPPPGDLPNPSVPTSLASLALLCYALLLSHDQLFGTSWTVAHQAPLSMGILQARILERVAMPSSRGSSQPRDWTQVSRIPDLFIIIYYYLLLIYYYYLLFIIIYLLFIYLDYLPYDPPGKPKRHRWRSWGVNPGPWTCEACALPLSYTPLHWQADSLPLHHLGSPYYFIRRSINTIEWSSLSQIL